MCREHNFCRGRLAGEQAMGGFQKWYRCLMTRILLNLFIIWSFVTIATHHWNMSGVNIFSIFGMNKLTNTVTTVSSSEFSMNAVNSESSSFLRNGNYQYVVLIVLQPSNTPLANRSLNIWYPLWSCFKITSGGLNIWRDVRFYWHLEL